MALMRRCMNLKVNIIIAACCLATACAAPRVTQDHERDSLVVVIRDSICLRDSFVLVPVPQGSDKTILPDTDTSFLSTGVAESVAYVKDGKLHHSLRNRTEAVVPVKISIPERLHYEKQDRLNMYKVVEYVEVEKQLSRWQQFMMSLGWVVIVGTVTWLAWKIYRLVRI